MKKDERKSAKTMERLTNKKIVMRYGLAVLVLLIPVGFWILDALSILAGKSKKIRPY